MKLRSPESLRLTIERNTERDEDSECLIWSGNLNGYIQPRINIDSAGHQGTVSRINWALRYGKIPEGHIVARRPTCTNKRCVEPAHFELMEGDRGNVAATAAIRRVSTTPTVEEAIVNINTRKTHCKRGHEFTPENTLIQTRKAGTDKYGRACRACRKQHQDNRRAAAKTAAAQPKAA
jgi:hypothetical protein